MQHVYKLNQEIQAICAYALADIQETYVTPVLHVLIVNYIRTYVTMQKIIPNYVNQHLIIISLLKIYAQNHVARVPSW